MNKSNNKFTIIMLALIIILLSCVIVSIWTHLPKVKSKNEKIDRGIAAEIDSIVYGNECINEEEAEQTNEEQNENQTTINSEKENPEQDYAM